MKYLGRIGSARERERRRERDERGVSGRRL